MDTVPLLASKKVSNALRGFTLIEMVVVLAIIGVITTISVTGQSTFNKSILLTDTAYSVAFSAREAQAYGLSSRTNTDDNTGYGLHFDAVSPSQYLLFADTDGTVDRSTAGALGCSLGTVGKPDAKPGDCQYKETPEGRPALRTYAFNRGFTIQKFCGKNATGLYCSGGVGNSPLSSLDIVFTRPNTATSILGRINGNLNAFTCAEITVQDATGTAERYVRISSLGEITIGYKCP